MLLFCMHQSIWGRHNNSKLEIIEQTKLGRFWIQNRKWPTILLFLIVSSTVFYWVFFCLHASFLSLLLALSSTSDFLFSKFLIYFLERDWLLFNFINLFFFHPCFSSVFLFLLLPLSFYCYICLSLYLFLAILQFLCSSFFPRLSFFALPYPMLLFAGLTYLIFSPTCSLNVYFPHNPSSNTYNKILTLHFNPKQPELTK